MATPTFTKSGTKASTPVKLNKNIFDVAVDNHDLLQRAYLSYLQNARNAHPNVKTRGLVRGGGRKPWRQKGTGRARFGSIRNPIWTGGGTVFGPTGNENHQMQLTKRERQTALKQALTLKKDALMVIEDIQLKLPKTSELVKLLNKIGVKRNICLIVESKTDELTRAANNLKYVTVVSAAYVNTNDVLNADTIVATKKAIESIHERLGGNG